VIITLAIAYLCWCLSSSRSACSCTRIVSGLDLLLDGEEEDVERRAGAVVDEVVEQEGEPVGEHLLGDGLVAPQQDLGVAVLGLDGLLDEVGEEREEHVGEVVHVVVEAQA